VFDMPDAGCWLHPDLEIRPSPIAGKGLFARAPVEAGTIVSRLGGDHWVPALLTRIRRSA